MESKIYKCRDCGVEFTAEPIMWEGRDLMSVRACPPCVAAYDAAVREETATARRLELEDGWRRICPPLLQSTDWARIPEALRNAVDGWSGAVGLGFAGDAGKGKTRAAYEALRRQHFAGKTCSAVTGVGLAHALVDSFSEDSRTRNEARSVLANARCAEFLLIDDIGKQKLTDSGEAELYDLLDTRMVHYRPTLWTSNSSSRQLGNRFSEDRGNAIIRRLCENTTVVKA